MALIFTKSGNLGGFSFVFIKVLYEYCLNVILGQGVEPASKPDLVGKSNDVGKKHRGIQHHIVTDHRSYHFFIFL